MPNRFMAWRQLNTIRDGNYLEASQRRGTILSGCRAKVSRHLDTRLCQFGAGYHSNLNQSLPMLYTIAVILLVAWLIGLVSAYTLGGFIHILLVLAIVMILVNVIQGRRI